MDTSPVTLLDLVPPCAEVILTSDLNRQQAALLHLRQNLVKKWEPAGVNRKADKAALDLFLTSSARCKSWVPNHESYYSDILLVAKQRFVERYFNGELQAPLVTLAQCGELFRPGPGSSAGVDAPDFMGKVFGSCMTAYDKHLWSHYRQCIPASWRLAENMREIQWGGCTVIPAARLTFAKKYFDISRVINTEASLNMMYQLALGTQIEGLLMSWFNINLSTQPTMNRFLARLGSVYGNYATIDLKSASDLISCEFVRWFLPPQLFSTLNSVRSKEIILPDGTMHEQGMFSTMGNGFTFPLQTLIFSCIVEAVYESMGLPTDNTGRTPAFSVFGDDIICVSTAFDKVCRALEWAGHTVNATKSFNTGSFRESCGEDYFKGFNIRSVYIKKLSHETHAYSVFNRLTRWSIRNGVDLRCLLRHVKGLAKFQPVPFDESDSAGFKVPFALSGLKQNSCGSVRYKAARPVPNKMHTGNYETNEYGLLIAAIGGYILGTADTKQIPLPPTRENMALVEGTEPLVVETTDVLGRFDYARVTGGLVVRDRPDGPPRTRTRRYSTTSWDWVPFRDLTTLHYRLELAVL